MGVWDWNMTSGKVTWSPSLEASHGLVPGTFGGTFDDYLRDVHPEDFDSLRQAISQSLEAKGDHDVEYRIIWPDGSIHWIQGKGAWWWMQGRSCWKPASAWTSPTANERRTR
jgi:PAS domain-containing protein